MDRLETRRTAVSGRRIASLLTVGLLAGLSQVPVTGPVASANRTVITFRHIQVQDHRVSIRYTLNRRPSHITSRRCILNNGITRVEAKCGRLPSTDTRPTHVLVVLRGLAYGDYTYTVRAFYKRSLQAKATSPLFSLNGGFQLDQSNDPGGVAAAVSPSCVDVQGSDWAQTFTAGRDGLLRDVSVIAVKEGDAPDLVVTITGLAAGFPDEAVVFGGGTYSGRGSRDRDTFIDIRLTTPAFLTQGQQYAVVLTAPDPDGVCPPDNFWTVAGSDATYAGGTWEFRTPGGPWDDSGYDQAFKTWLDP